MTKELYDELVEKRFITNTYITLDEINEMKLELKDIITQPMVYEYFLNKYNITDEIPATPYIEPVVDETISNPVVYNESEIVEITEVNEDEIPSNEQILDCIEVNEDTAEKEIEVDEPTDEINIE